MEKNKLVVRVERVSGRGNIPLPSYAHPHDAGLDLRAACNRRLKPGERALIPTGIRVAIPPGYVGIIKDRSGLALHKGIHILAGVIDSGYRGEVGVVLLNLGEEDFLIREGDRVAQLLILPVVEVKWDESPLEGTLRGEKGWGSTGKE